MKKTIKIIKKSFLIAIICLEIIMLNVAPAQAVLGSLIGGILGSSGAASGNANGMLEQMEQRYHLNKDSIKSFGESFNVSEQKQITPEVKIMFSPQKPKLGEKVTATAYATGFQDGAEDLYFVWYLKNKVCTKTKTPDSKKKVLCDVDDSGMVTETDWMVKAMRINATNGFDSSTANYSSDTDNDGFKATLGGNNNRQDKDSYRCYINDSGSGKNYEIASAEGMDRVNDFPTCSGPVLCTSPYLISCIEGRVDVPEQPLGSITGTPGEGGAGGAGGTDGSGGGGGGGGSAGSISGDFAIPKHEEHYTGFRSTGVTDSGYAPYCNPETKKATCPAGTTPRCIEGSKEECFELDPTDDRICTNCSISCPADEYPVRVENSSFVDPTCEFMTMIISKYGRYTEVLSDPGEKDISCSTTVASEDNLDQDWADLYESESGDEDIQKGSGAEQECGHLFPRTRDGQVGDGKFGSVEEEFWGTDPHKFSTSGNGKSDEANVAGLGADSFTWTYTPGDKIGVIVEGSSFLPTKHDDASKAITFALAKNIFDGGENSLCKLDEKQLYSEKIKGYDVEIPIARIDLLECLELNLVDPNNGDHGGILKTELSYSPENPVLGGVGTGSQRLNGGDALGDVVTVTANTSNLSLDNNQVYYKWSVYATSASKDSVVLDNDAWQIISEATRDNLNFDFKAKNGVTFYEGLGMDEFNFRLNELPKVKNYLNGRVDEVTYLKVSAELEEYYGEDSFGMTGTTSSGRSEVIIPINNTATADKFKITVGNSGDICATASGACEVLNNQVINAEIPAGQGRNFLWTLNGKKIEYSVGNEDKQGNKIKFLVQGKPGDTFLLNVLANDTNTPNYAAGSTVNDGEKLNFSRNFVIVNPRVALGPNNEINRGSGDCQSMTGEAATPIGTYHDPTNGEDIPDCRETVFEANGTFDVPVSYYPSFISSEASSRAKFYVNGVAQESGSIDLTSYPVGSMVNVTVETSYNPVALTEANVSDLSNTWGVSHAEATTYQKLSDSIVIRVTESDTVGVKKASKIIAGLAYNLPQQMIFIFRMMLTTLVIIFTAGVLMALTKKDYIK